MATFSTALDRILQSLSKTVGATLEPGDYYDSARRIIEDLGPRHFMVESHYDGPKITAVSKPVAAVGGMALFADTFHVWIKLDLDVKAATDDLEKLDNAGLLSLPTKKNKDGVIHFAAGVTFSSDGNPIRAETPVFFGTVDRDGKVSRF